MLISSPTFIRAVPMSKWFERELRKCPQVDKSKIAHAIYHGVDPEVFYPSPNPQISPPKGCDFFVITVAANTGHRENLPEMIEGFAIFLKESGANAYYYIHDFPYSVTGYNLRNCIVMCEELYGIALMNRIAFKQDLVLPDSFMRDLYTIADCQLMAIQQGSFEIPIIEAGACGTPTITTGNTPMAELVGGGERGLVVPPVAPIWANLTSSRQWIVSPNDIAKALMTYYENPSLRKEHGEKMRRWVLGNATWDLVGQKWLELLDELEHEIRSYGRAYFAIREGMGGAGEDLIIAQRVAGKVLEVGCGLGQLLEILNRDGCEAEGVDISEYAVQRCREKGLRARVANAENLPFEDSSFDYVVGEHLLEHCDDPMKALREMLRVAKNGVVVIVPGHTGRDLTHRRHYTREMVEELCRKLDGYKAKFWQVDGVPDWVLEIKKPKGKETRCQR
jgi:SAM-dependent methyltransferase